MPPQRSTDKQPKTQVTKLLILIRLSRQRRVSCQSPAVPWDPAGRNEVHSPTSTRAECVQSTPPPPPTRIRAVMHAHKCWLSWHGGLKDCRAARKCASQLVEDKLGLDWVASRQRCLTSSHWVNEEPPPSGTNVGVLHHRPSVRWAILSATFPSISVRDQTRPTTAEVASGEVYKTSERASVRTLHTLLRWHGRTGTHTHTKSNSGT